MHYHLEIIMPATDSPEITVANVLATFDENKEEPDGSEFWDFYVIGGRLAGDKLTKKLDQEKLKAFTDKLDEMKVTVSGFQAGKQELKPADQIPVIDSLWREYFPDSGIEVCPLFAHSNDQYHEALLGDICKYSDLPDSYNCSRLIFAGPDFEGSIAAYFMLSEDIWNGTNHEKTEWDGTLGRARELISKYCERYTDEYRKTHTPTDDWLAVTVDYHS